MYFCIVSLARMLFMIESVQKYITTKQLPNAPAKVIVAVSGGADSVALLHILIQLGYTCVLAHCNFHLREEASNTDAKFVSNLAEKLKLPCFIKEFNTHDYALGNKISIEMAARDLRYTWFEQLRNEQNAVAIAVAHHADDVVETFLINLCRGTGIHGLTGIKPLNNHIMRPLLSTTRQAIEHYLKEQHITYVTDASNNEQVFVRNKFRHTIIPSLKAINPAFNQTIGDTIERLDEVALLYQERLDQIKKKLIKPINGGFSVEIEAVKNQPAKASVLFEIFSPLGFSAATIYDLIRSLDGVSGKQFLSTTHRIIKDRDTILVSSIDKAPEKETYTLYPEQKTISKPICLRIETIKNNTNLVISKDKKVAYLDADKLSFPLHIRKWEKGDYFTPIGMQGKKKLSDYFIDKKFPLSKKENTWLLFSENHLAWIIGQQIDKRFRITKNTKNILLITLFSE